MHQLFPERPRLPWHMTTNGSDNDSRPDEDDELPDQEQATGGGRSSLSAVLQALCHRRRRELLYYLRAHDTGTVDELARHIARVEQVDTSAPSQEELTREIRIQLHHRHLPKLTETLDVEFDARSHTVRHANPSPTLELLLEVARQIERGDGDS